MRTLSILGLMFACSACSEATNFNQIFVSKEQKEAVDYLLERGQYHYDKKEFGEALKFAEKAYGINPGNEDSSVLLAYTHLAVGGVDVFGLSENLIDQSDSKSDEKSSGAVSSLSQLEKAIGLKDEDVLEMEAEGNKRDIADRTVSGVSETPIFVNHPVTLPDTAVNARVRAEHLLRHLSRAIEIVCPFVSDKVKVLKTPVSTIEDPRHSKDVCPPADLSQQGAKAHFVWALAHLTEGVAFNAFFSKMNEGISARSKALEGQQIPVGEYVTALTELADIINIMMPTDPDEAQDAMLRAVFNDLDATARAFEVMAGMPESLTKSVTQALSDLRAKSSKLDRSAGDKDSAALKAQLLEKNTAKIRDEMNKREASLSQQQKDDACRAYNSITTEPFAMCPRS